MDFRKDMDEMTIFNVLTPCKEAQCGSPFSDKDKFIDEDSGIGMEDCQDIKENNPPTVSNRETPTSLDRSVEELSRQFAMFGKPGLTGLTRRSLFPSMKRPLDNDGTEYSENVGKIQKAPDGSRRFLKKSLSFGDEPLSAREMKTMVNRLATESDLVGDGSRQCCLPTIPGKHGDLKSISNDTVRDLLLGKYEETVDRFRLIDCRYPYEYEAGHVEGASNLYTKEMVEGLMDETLTRTDGDKRDILIFYCEFSSERGPKMYRHLRKIDRQMNKDCYPRLNYPEIYLMHNGYKSFYESHKIFCNPCDYKPMLHKEHASDLRHFRSKSKSWTEGTKRRSIAQRLSF